MTARAVLLAALLAAPLAAAGQNIGVAQLQNENDNTELDFIGLAQCRGEVGQDTLRWTLNTGGTGFSLGGDYRIFVSNKPPLTSGTDAGFCPQENTEEGTLREQVGSTFDANVGPTSTLDIITSTIPAALGLACDETAGEEQIYLCVEWTNLAGQRAGFANVELTLELQPPPPPTITGVSASEGALEVQWAEGTIGAGQVDSFEYEAVASVGDVVARRSRVRATSTRIEGLQNGTTYSVVVYAYSKGNNQSAPSAARTATPIPIDDFWEHYQRSGGPDDGGCASGPAGLGALAGLVLALAFRRSRK